MPKNTGKRGDGVGFRSPIESISFIKTIDSLNPPYKISVRVAARTEHRTTPYSLLPFL